MSHGANSKLSIFYALGANLFVALAKFVAAMITGSGSMLAESIHSLADTANQILLLLGLRQAKKAPNDDYPLGYGKAIYFWSFIVAVMLFSMGGLFSVYEGIHKLSSKQALEKPLIAIIVLLLAILAEGASLLGVLREVRKNLKGRSIFRWFKESRKSELLIVVGEDSAAIVGLLLALVAIILSVLTNNPIYDAIGSILIGVLLVIVAIFIGREVMSLLIGEGVEPRVKKEMVEFINSLEDVEHLFNIITLQLGEDIMLAVKVKMKKANSGVELVKMINNCEKEIKKKFSNVLWLFFEPDIVDDDEHT